MLFKKKNHTKAQINNSDLIEARKEQLKILVKKHQKALMLILIAFLVLLTIWFSYKAYNKAKEEKYSAILQQVLIDTEKGNINAANNSLKELYQNHSVPAGVRSLASLKYAATLLNDDKIDEAVNVYIEINKTKKFDPYLRELAGLLALKSMIDANSSIFDDKIKSLGEDLAKNSKTLKYFVSEQMGIFEWNHGNDKEANKIFRDLADNPEAPQSVKTRSKEMAQITSKNVPQQIESVKEKDNSVDKNAKIKTK